MSNNAASVLIVAISAAICGFIMYLDSRRK